MRQFTDQRIDSEQFARGARNKQIELQISMLVMATKRAIRNSSLYQTVTLSHYDTLIVTIERSIREWLIAKDEDRDYESLVKAINRAVKANPLSLSEPEIVDLINSIDQEVHQLKEVNFLNLF